MSSSRTARQGAMLEARLGARALLWPALPAAAGLLLIVIALSGTAVEDDEREILLAGVAALLVAAVVLVIVRRVRAFVLPDGHLVVRVLGERQVDLNRLAEVRILPEAYRATTASYHLTLIDADGSRLDLHEQWSWVPRSALWRHVRTGIERSGVTVSGVTQAVLARLTQPDSS